jgi:hypothetical protein
MIRLLSFAPLGGLCGSVLGAIIWAAIAVCRTTTRQEAVIAAIQNGLGALVFTVIFTIPVCIVLGSPVVYVFRKQLVRNPIPWAAFIGFLGVGVGLACFGWDPASNTNQEMIGMLSLFSYSSAFCYAGLYGWRTRIRRRKSVR